MSFNLFDGDSIFILRKGIKIKNEISSLINATKLGSKPVKLPLINPKEKAQMKETIRRYSIESLYILKQK